MNPAYVHVKKNTKVSIEKIKSELEKRNIFLVGRYAMWKYCSIEDNILESRELANQINDIHNNSYL